MQVKMSKPMAAAQQIQSLIRSGRMREGERLLSQKDLARSLNVSRATLREALLFLENIGFVTIEPGNGTFVCRNLPSASNAQVPWRDPATFSPQNVFQTRMILEGEMVALLAPSILPDLIDELTQLTDRMETAWDDLEIVSHIEADLEFHRRMADNCPNRLLAAMYRHHKEQLTETQRQPVLRTDAVEMGRSIDGHRRILAALQSRDGARAQEAMRAHIMHTAMSSGLAGDGF